MPESTSQRLTRLLAMVSYLADRPGVEVRSVADHFGVSPEQILQDVDLLWVSGAPGYQHTDLLDFSADDLDRGLVHLVNDQGMGTPLRLSALEATALLSAMRALAAEEHLADPTTLASAIAKLADAAGQGAAAQTLSVDLAEAATPGHTQVLREAIASGVQVRLRYVSASDETTERVVDPLGVFTDSEHWFLHAWCHRSQGERYFRIDRIVELEVLTVPAGAHPKVAGPSPTGFSSRGHRAVDLDLDASARWLADELDAQDLHRHDGALRVRIAVADTAWLRALVLAHGGHVRVAAPPDVAAEVTDFAMRALAAYERLAPDAGQVEA